MYTFTCLDILTGGCLEGLKAKIPGVVLLNPMVCIPSLSSHDLLSVLPVLPLRLSYLG
ncbi:hypothetical protein M407DRAFT_245380 [Tulasnella calospora MUT 4182]|uniref:Uncharacterized protein n=1 Tax=Tulasnella calospora MUT 4182 TaxID=1051891 RepID=A0A0C3LKA1_9AGAM|nr:hypothetical protein M407DRAFT_245380 [Tulasnella calospora MUT 4182]